MTDGRIIPWRRVGGVAAALAVGAIAAIGSFAHLRDLAIENGQTHLIGTLIPFSVDGLIVTATLCMHADNRRWPRIGFWLGVAATISGNVLQALAPVSMAVAIAVSAWPPVALLVTIEIIVHRKVSDRSPVLASEPAPAAAAVVEPEPVKVEPPLPKVAPATARKIAKAAARKPSAKTTELAAATGVSETTVRRALALEAAKGDDPDAELAYLIKEEVTA
jgi:hypothetical protein